MAVARRQSGEKQPDVGAARDVVGNDQHWPPQATKILAADDAWVAKDLRGGPDECVIDREPQPADRFALRPSRIDVFGAAGSGLFEDPFHIGDGLGINESSFIK